MFCFVPLVNFVNSSFIIQTQQQLILVAVERLDKKRRALASPSRNERQYARLRWNGREDGDDVRCETNEGNTRQEAGRDARIILGKPMTNGSLLIKEPPMIVRFNLAGVEAPGGVWLRSIIN